MFRSGAFVAEQLRGAGGNAIGSEQVQPNGVDLTAGSIYEQTAPGAIGRDDKRVGDREPVEPDGGRYRLDRGAYALEYGEVVRVPREHVGFVYPRSSLMRNSCMLNTAVWDAGYEGVGEGLLRVGHPVEIERGARVAQFVLAAADHGGTYDGDYQAERL